MGLRYHLAYWVGAVVWVPVLALASGSEPRPPKMECFAMVAPVVNGVPGTNDVSAAYASDVQQIHFSFNQPGLQMSVVHGPYSGNHTRGAELQSFRLFYDPSHFGRLSVIRRTLGNQPRVLTEADVRRASNATMLGTGSVFELYLRGPGGGEYSDGGLIQISRDTGRLQFYAPGSNTNGGGNGGLGGTLRAAASFGMGLAGELQCLLCRYSGSWYTDRDIIDVTPRRALPAVPATGEPPALPPPPSDG